MRTTVSMPVARKPSQRRIGIDLGGTKIEGVVMDEAGGERPRRRVPTPRDDYEATIEAIATLVDDLIAEAGTSAATGACTVGIATPGSVSPRTGRMQNANSTWLNGRSLGPDLASRVGLPVRLANDANCFALSEALDGAAAGARNVLGVILGTGCGAGIVIDGQLLDGPRGIGGEWGHNPLPWAAADELPGPLCWCGRRGCMETWVSGPALAAAYLQDGGDTTRAEDIVARATAGEARARAALDRHADRLARGLAHVVNIVDPDIIVLGGGLSRLPHLYEQLPGLMAPHIFAEDTRVDIRPPRWGDASGARGAAWLWRGAP
ncbi:MAG TPA: ROK family protein [Hyphomicrobiaceae bacterium]|nr:ROK family protein [Hyphomicrobiaceae bacterium]